MYTDTTDKELEKLLAHALELKVRTEIRKEDINYHLDSFNYSAELGELARSESSRTHVKIDNQYIGVNDVNPIIDNLYEKLEEGIGLFVPVAHITGISTLKKYNAIPGLGFSTNSQLPDELYYFDNALLTKNELRRKL